MKRIAVLLALVLALGSFLALPTMAATDISGSWRTRVLEKFELVRGSLPEDYKYCMAFVGSMGTNNDAVLMLFLEEPVVTFPTVSGGGSVPSMRGYLFYSAFDIQRTGTVAFIPDFTGSSIAIPFQWSQSLSFTARYFVEDFSTARMERMDHWPDSVMGHIGEVGVPLGIDGSELLQLLAEAAVLDNSLYMPDSWAVLEDAVEYANRTLNGGDITQAKVDNAAMMLRSALNGLELLPDTSELQALILQAESMDMTGYSVPSVTAVHMAASFAKSLLAEGGYTHSQVENARQALRSALDGLTLLPDASGLEALIAQAESLDVSGYTAASVSGLTAAVAQAKALLLTGNFTESQIATQIQRIQNAISGLREPVDGVIDGEVYEDFLEGLNKTMFGILAVGILIFGILLALSVAIWHMRRLMLRGAG